MTRDCGPALAQLVNEENKQAMMAGPILIPPRHTRSLRLELPFEIPVDMAHCSGTIRFFFRLRSMSFFAIYFHFSKQSLFPSRANQYSHVSEVTLPLYHSVVGE